MPSSVVSSFSYDVSSKILTVTFVSGLVYNYKKVPKKIYNEMKNSISKGTFLNKYIKGNYSFEKVIDSERNYKS